MEQQQPEWAAIPAATWNKAIATLTRELSMDKAEEIVVALRTQVVAVPAHVIQQLTQQPAPPVDTGKEGEAQSAAGANGSAEAE